MKIRRHRYTKKSRRKFTAFMLIFAFLTSAVFFIDCLRPKIAEYAENEVEYRVTVALENVVFSAMQGKSHAVASIKQLDSGMTAALITNSAAAEQIRSEAVKNAYKEINKMENAPMSVPIGTLADPQYLAGIGPSVHFRIVGLGKISAKIQSDFTDCGINQTKYCMKMQMKAEVRLHALWYSKTIYVNNTYPLSETVIVGSVPSVNLQ